MASSSATCLAEAPEAGWVDPTFGEKPVERAGKFTRWRVLGGGGRSHAPAHGDTQLARVAVDLGFLLARRPTAPSAGADGASACAMLLPAACTFRPRALPARRSPGYTSWAMNFPGATEPAPPQKSPAPTHHERWPTLRLPSNRPERGSWRHESTLPNWIVDGHRTQFSFACKSMPVAAADVSC